LVPEGLADITTSLIIAVEGDSIYDEGIAETFEWLSWGQPLAGGAVQSNRPWLMYQRPDPKDVFRRLGPGTLLLSRSLFLEQHYQQQRAAGRKLSRLDAVLDICEIRYTYNGSEWACQSLKNEWLVPLPGGYAGISPVYDPGVVKGARSPSVPCQFAEPTLTLGAWVSPRKVTDLADVVWNYAYEDPYYNCLTVEKEQHGLKEEEDSSDDGNEGDGGD
jgi:CRISPR-associated protein Csy2